MPLKYATPPRQAIMLKPLPLLHLTLKGNIDTKYVVILVLRRCLQKQDAGGRAELQWVPQNEEAILMSRMLAQLHVLPRG